MTTVSTRYCPDCGMSHASTTAACPHKAQTTTAASDPPRSPTTPRERLWNVKAKVDPLLGLDSEKASDDPATWHIVDLAEAVDDMCDLLLSAGLFLTERIVGGHEGGQETVGRSAMSKPAGKERPEEAGASPAQAPTVPPHPDRARVEEAIAGFESVVADYWHHHGTSLRVTTSDIAVARQALLAHYDALLLEIKSAADRIAALTRRAEAAEAEAAEANKTAGSWMRDAAAKERVAQQWDQQWNRLALALGLTDDDPDDDWQPERVVDRAIAALQSAATLQVAAVEGVVINVGLGDPIMASCGLVLPSRLDPFDAERGAHINPSGCVIVARVGLGDPIIVARGFAPGTRVRITPIAEGGER